MHRLARRVVVVFVICSLAGCAMIYSYRNIDRFVRWWIDDYIVWDSAQESQLRARLDAQLEWHQRTQLPRYRDWLEAMDRSLAGEIDLATSKEAARQLESFSREAAEHLQGDIQAQLALLSDDQVSDLMAAVREKLADLENEYGDLTPAALVKKRKRDMTKRIKYWVGPLEGNQTALIEAWARRMPDSRSQWLHYRDRWADVFAEALRQRHDSQAFSEQIRVLFVSPQEDLMPEYRELTERNRESILQLLVALHNSRTPEQREFERKRIAQWLGHLDQLAAE